MKIVTESAESLMEMLVSAQTETPQIKSAIDKISRMSEREKFWEHRFILSLHARLFVLDK